MKAEVDLNSIRIRVYLADYVIGTSCECNAELKVIETYEGADDTIFVTVEPCGFCEEEEEKEALDEASSRGEI